MCGAIEDEGLKAMAAWRRAIELSLGQADVERLRSISQSRTEPASRIERARILLAYREDPSFLAVGRALGLHHQTVQRCAERAVVEGPMAALDDRPRPGKEPTITIEVKAWLTCWLAGRRRNSASRRRLLLQASPLRPAPHPCLPQTGAQGAPHGRGRLLQLRSSRSHMDLQARQGRLI